MFLMIRKAILGEITSQANFKIRGLIPSGPVAFAYKCRYLRRRDKWDLKKYIVWNLFTNTVANIRNVTSD